MIYTSTLGLFHLIVSILALIAGTWVITTQKGTTIHKRIGYFYAANMVAVIVTSFMMYRLFGGFGVFHVAAIVSGVTLLGGMVPVILRKPEKSWLSLHFGFMFWSVMGLYAAFVAEIFTRIPGLRFFWMVGVGTGLVMFVGAFAFAFYKKRWEKIEKVYMENS